MRKYYLNTSATNNNVSLSHSQRGGKKKAGNMARKKMLQDVSFGKDEGQTFDLESSDLETYMNMHGHK